MTETETKSSKASVGWAATAVYLCSALVLAYYLYQLRTMEPLDMGRFRFQYFPVPVFTEISELVFLLLVVGLGAWHMVRGLKGGPQSSGTFRRTIQFVFGLALLATPWFFRTTAQFISTAIRGE